MNVEVILRIDGREVATLNQQISGQPGDNEQQTETLKDRIGQVLLPEAFFRFDEKLRRPCCCGKAMHRKGTRSVTVMCQSGEINFKHRRYRCSECHRCCTPADALVWCGKHRITRHLGKLICQLATLEHLTRLEQLMADQHSVHLGYDDMLRLVHDVGTVVDVQRQTTAKFAMESPSRIKAKVRPKQVYVSCDGIMYCTNEREPCPADPNTIPAAGREEFLVGVGRIAAVSLYQLPGPVVSGCGEYLNLRRFGSTVDGSGLKITTSN